MIIRIVINGFGRVGRSIVRAIYENGLQDEIRIVAINELAEPEAIVHLLKYDTTHGRFKADVCIENNRLKVNDDSIHLLNESDLTQLPWMNMRVDVVMECSGVVRGFEDSYIHVRQGAKKVLLSHPGDTHMDATIVYGVNQQSLNAKDKIVSAASCTTNACVPVITVLDDAFEIDSGSVTTIHSAMNDQQVIDAYHTDLRRTRAASQSIIPVDTKLAVGIERILPKFAGRFEAISVRVPTINVTSLILTVTVKDEVKIQDVNNAIKKAATGALKGILDYTEDPLVSSDFNHDPHSCIVDGTQTRVSHGKLVKVLIWCDNEWGYANRMIDVCRAMMK
ncbi:erythrose-4-phosphate dehydrogenase [Catenovulum maritimum]|uniref:Glyceraldehyde 3-phosphate dehydrogenase NAD(P) binding domain-containing protein n=1 Tax=Catenovulum maritimum TaxID=1513271 RepID=A0A0J8GQC4_9ALTE|nr:erythrose-4-phosphate dehydrogenase [Catenovulum maritimum]KMT64942.1 hypothetical protein XM47_11820 [Catenovulum maritimum]